MIDIGPMESPLALALLEKTLGSSKPYQNHDAQELMKALDHMPIAISQAAAFICKVPSMSVSDYLEALHKSEKDAADILTLGK